MGNCTGKHSRRRETQVEDPKFVVNREIHDTRRMGITLSIAKSNDKMGVDSEVSAKCSHDIVETFGEPKTFETYEIPSVLEVMRSEKESSKDDAKPERSAKPENKDAKEE